MKPSHPQQVAAWLATLPDNLLLPEAQALAGELATLKGHGLPASNGCAITEMSLGDLTVKVEYEYDHGQIETRDEPGYPGYVAILGVFLNGQWVDPQECISEKVIARWEEKLMEDLNEGGQDYDDGCDGDDYWAERAADKYERELDARASQ